MLEHETPATARASSAARVALRSSETAWAAVVPCAAVIVAAMVLLAAPLGDAFLRPRAADAIWPPEAVYGYGHPEPAKHARFAIALLGPLLLAAIVLAAARRPPQLRLRTIRMLVAGGQTLTVAGLAAALLAQNDLLLQTPFTHWSIFPVGVLAAALALPLALLSGLRHPHVAERVAQLARETRARRVACIVVAAAITTSWLLIALNTEGSIGNAIFSDLPPWAMGDTLAILNGRTPLVDFYAMYGQLWAYAAAVPLSLLGATIAVFSIAMTIASGLSLLAVYGTFRRVVRSSVLALLLYLPVLAIGFYAFPLAHGRPASNAQVFSVWPMRYAGPYLLAWLTARQLDGVAPRRRWVLFLVAGLVVLNNLEFGLGAFAGTLAALVCVQPPRSWRAAARFALEAAAGALGALLLVALLTLARSGQLPQLSFLVLYPRIFGTAGFIAYPLSAVGFHLVLYATYVAAIGSAVVRAVSRAEDRVLTGLLAWAGVFGLVSAGYYIGRSDDPKLVSLFSAWGFALALLTVVVARGLAARGWRHPTVAELLVLVGFGIACVSLHALPSPWSQIRRIQATTATPLYQQAAETHFVAVDTRPHERVAILLPMGHRIAQDAGVRNVAPFALMQALVTRRQLELLVDAIHREHAHKVFLPTVELAPALVSALNGRGLALRRTEANAVELAERR